MQLCLEIIKNNWSGDGIFPEWWDLPTYHKLWMAPLLLVQSSIAIPSLIIREYQREKRSHLKEHKKLAR